MPHTSSVVLIRRALVMVFALAATACGEARTGDESPDQPNATPSTEREPAPTVQAAPETARPAVTPVALLDDPLPPRHSGPPPDEVFGEMRSDGVVLPLLARTAGGWSSIADLAGFHDPGPWSAVTSYYRRDSTGVMDTVHVEGMVVVCCAYEGNPIWAHRTDRSPPEVERYSSGASSYVTTSVEGSAPFTQSQRTPPPSLEQLFDSLSTLPDSVPTGISMNVWTAALEGSSHAFFRAVQANTRFYSGCHVIEGWLTDTAPERIDIVSQGADDCEGKGYTYHRPLALLRRGGELLMVIDLSSYGEARTEVWSHLGGTRWNATFEPVPSAPRPEPEPAPWPLDVVGLRMGEVAMQYFVWNGADWERSSESLPEGSMVAFGGPRRAHSALTLGQARSGIWDDPDVVGYDIMGADRDVDRDRRRGEPLGYFLARATGHGSFQPVEADWALPGWEAITDDALPPVSPGAARASVEVWLASTGTTSVRFFAITRSGAGNDCSVGREQVTGWILSERSSDPVGVSVSSGDCEGKGMDARRPYALIPRGGRRFVLLGVSSWGWDEAEVWEVTSSGATNVTPRRVTIGGA